MTTVTDHHWHGDSPGRRRPSRSLAGGHRDATAGHGHGAGPALLALPLGVPVARHGPGPGWPSWRSGSYLRPGPGPAKQTHWPTPCPTWSPGVAFEADETCQCGGSFAEVQVPRPWLSEVHESGTCRPAGSRREPRLTAPGPGSSWRGRHAAVPPAAAGGGQLTRLLRCAPCAWRAEPPPPMRARQGLGPNRSAAPTPPADGSSPRRRKCPAAHADGGAAGASESPPRRSCVCVGVGSGGRGP